MVTATPADGSILSRVGSKAWNWARGEAAEAQRVGLVLVVDAVPSGLRGTRGPLVLFTVDHAKRVHLTYDQFVGMASSLKVRDVAYYGDEVPSNVAASLLAQGHRARFDGQQDGFWTGPRDSVPERMPHWRPETALLLAREGAGHAQFSKLLLPLEPDMGWWCPVRYEAARVYRWAVGIGEEERWRFFPVARDAAAWPTKPLEFKQLVYLPAHDVAPVFGLTSDRWSPGDILVCLEPVT
jgi:hypothetical protein